MEIRKIHFPSVMLDSDMQYLAYIIDILSSIDPDSQLIISRGSTSIGFTLRPSKTTLWDNLIQHIKQAHIDLGLVVEMTSTKHSNYITFRLLAPK